MAAATTPVGSAAPPRVDWEAIERLPEFQELVRRRRAFVIPCTVFFLSYYMGFMALCAFAPDFMAERVYEGLTVGYTLALTQFVMVAVLGLWYLRRAERVFDPLAQRVVEHAEGGVLERVDEREQRRRFTREPEQAAEPAVAPTEPSPRKWSL